MGLFLLYFPTHYHCYIGKPLFYLRYLINSIINSNNFSIDSSGFPQYDNLYCIKLVKQEPCCPRASSLHCSELELAKRGIWTTFGHGGEAAAVIL